MRCPLSRSKPITSSAVQPSTAPTPATTSVATRKRTTTARASPTAAVPAAAVTLPVIKIPVANGGTPATTTATSTTTVALPAPALASVPDTPPSQTAPTVPNGFSAPDMREFMGFRPNRTELSAMPAAINDLGNFVDYAALLGIGAPAATSVSGAITLGVQWRAQRGLAEAWDTYAKTQDAIAWKAALTLLEELKPLFLGAVVKKPELATTYPGLAQIFNAGKATSKQAEVTRKKNAKAAAVAAAATATAAQAAAVASAAAEATKAVATTAVTPKSVTVNT
jgi:trimeric autotransporter adhesin